ncbi:hypothetical protein A3D70_01770 [Candidatus Adlerbacteria bacterium RIFCSPHIGHO2_02_FULL_54_18]|uniref:methionyl-tRNA formyltransferase n=2 Tax=Candidatus Adleribacteriota TaxID=1752736 RepID=A0A1F4Y3I8_9BACT|nr:MAG: hypothetical protein A2949_01070 [Candidatus Adlerbacteria bacterium RIFCSPLOWO2_01_FULL_54_21b]OGC88535.1 MAG: hypothetical protein A3D70_01770 [Candidatus Adlerbacteria bacterium RIFCSPHIGHO2_02_FULL_54_18]
MAYKKPLFAFFGTPKFSVDVLNALERRGLLPALIIAAPDKARGRGHVLAPAPAKEWALERGIDCITPTTLRDEGLVAELKNTDWDVFVVAAYAKLIPPSLLDIPRRGVLNVHPSLLPKFRGPSPALSAILADERSTGVSIMQMTERMDEGPVVAAASVELEEEAWPPKGSMFEELLASEGGTLLAETLPLWLQGTLEAVPQDTSAATYTKKFTDEDAHINPHGGRQDLLKIRAFDSGPRAYFFDKNNKRIIVTEAQMQGEQLEIVKVIPEGKKEMSYADYLRGQHQQ